MADTHAAFGATEFQHATGCNDAALADVSAYRDLLGTWNERMNLVGPSAMEAFWLRHAFDSAQLRPLEPHAEIWADLGAGAGFPGLILAILLKQGGAGHVHLVESMAKRCMFLREIVETLRLPATIHNCRAEDAILPAVDVVTARALAPMSRLLSFAWPSLNVKGAATPVGLFLKGRGVDDELTEATLMWDFQVERILSLSDSSGQIIRVERLRRVQPF